MVTEVMRQQQAPMGASFSPPLPSSVEEEDDPTIRSSQLSHYTQSARSSNQYGNGNDVNDDQKRVHFEDPSFQPTHTGFTPRITDSSSLRYRKPGDRMSALAPPSSVSSIAQPNYDDTLRRVSVVLYQHIKRCERRHREMKRRVSGGGNYSDSANHFIATSGSATVAANTAANAGGSAPETAPTAVHKSSDSSTNKTGEESDVYSEDGEARSEGNQESQKSNHDWSSPPLHDLPVDELFREEHFVTPQFKYTFPRVGGSVHPLTMYAMRKISIRSHVPTVDEIFRFCMNLFKSAQLSPECTIVSLIYIERLMEQANVPLLARTWKPIVLCGLLLASKVWQDLSSWNVEISCIYPQYPLHSVNKLERLFLQYIQWDLYISASVYAKYYFALRSLTEKKDFRRRYNYVMRVDPPNSRRLEERSAAVKHELYSTSV